MRNILLTISYDGTNFCGWQRQDQTGKNVRTVQGEIEAALEKIHKAHIDLHGSGRTDSGVHARAQAANFFTPIDSIPEEKFVIALNSFLPNDVRIMSSKVVPDNFNARFSATSRTYRYFLHCGLSPLASEMPFVWALHRRPDINRLNDMASRLFGETDCATFAAAGDQSLSTNRYIEKAVFYPDGEKIVFEITANAFLWKMVRSLTGSFVHFEKMGLTGDDFEEILNSRDRKKAGPTAPPQGLFLWSINFDGLRRHV